MEGGRLFWQPVLPRCQRGWSLIPLAIDRIAYRPQTVIEGYEPHAASHLVRPPGVPAEMNIEQVTHIDVTTTWRTTAKPRNDA
jgi:hypothetical protein